MRGGRAGQGSNVAQRRHTAQSGRVYRCRTSEWGAQQAALHQHSSTKAWQRPVPPAVHFSGPVAIHSPLSWVQSVLFGNSPDGRPSAAVAASCSAAKGTASASTSRAAAASRGATSCHAGEGAGSAGATAAATVELAATASAASAAAASSEPHRMPEDIGCFHALHTDLGIRGLVGSSRDTQVWQWAPSKWAELLVVACYDDCFRQVEDETSGASWCDPA